jgi:hypothetical protein
MTNPPMNWDYARTVDGFFHAMSRGQYDHVNPAAHLNEYVSELWMFVKMTDTESGWPYLLLAVLPFFKIRRVNRHGRKWLWGLAILFLCTGPVLLAEINPSADFQSQQSMRFYFMPALTILSVLAGIGLTLCVKPLKTNTSV